MQQASNKLADASSRKVFGAGLLNKKKSVENNVLYQQHFYLEQLSLPILFVYHVF